MSRPVRGILCAWCRRDAVAICDFVTRYLEPGKMPRPTPCMLPVCALHQKNGGQGVDYCPTHYKLKHPEEGETAKAGVKRRARAKKKGPYGDED